jgi:hypothetical protein
MGQNPKPLKDEPFKWSAEKIGILPAADKERVVRMLAAMLCRRVLKDATVQQRAA